MGLNDSGEVAKYLGGIFEGAFGDSENGPKLVDPGLVVAFRFSELAAVVAVEMSNNPLATGSGGASPSGTITKTASLGNGYWQGERTLPMAVDTRKIAVDGNSASQFDLAPLGTKLYAGYVQRLKDDGREDLNV